MNYCPNCGSSLAEVPGASHCPECGTEVSKAAEDGLEPGRIDDVGSSSPDLQSGDAPEVFTRAIEGLEEYDHPQFTTARQILEAARDSWDSGNPKTET